MDGWIIKKSIRDIFISIFRNIIKDNLAFVHIPKCGGTSVTNAISKFYYYKSIKKLNNKNTLHVANWNESKNHEIRKNILQYELLNYQKPNNYPIFLTGHWKINKKVLEDFKFDSKFITILRKPENRFVSHFFFERVNKNNPMGLPQNITLREFVESEWAKKFEGAYIKHLTDFKQIDDSSIKETIEVLRMFDLIGITENMEDFRKRFKDDFGVNLNIQKENRNPLSLEKRQKEITPDLKAKIKKICEPDREVYEYVKNTMLKSKIKIYRIK